MLTSIFQCSPRRQLANFAVVLAILFGLPHQQSTAGQPTQSFMVVVPVESDVQPPPDVMKVSDLGATNLVFPPQSWTVRSNSMTGMVVDFSLDSAFIHTTQPESKSNASLQVAVASTAGPAGWFASKSSDQTNVDGGDESATVRVESDNVGSAKINLSVGFAQPDGLDVIPGTYEATVVTTVTLP